MIRTGLALLAACAVLSAGCFEVSRSSSTQVGPVEVGVPAVVTAAAATTDRAPMPRVVERPAQEVGPAPREVGSAPGGKEKAPDR